jgi:hypothetical protein
MPRLLRWRSLYVASLVLLLAFRVALPIYRTFLFRMRVESVHLEGPNVISIRMSGKGLDRLHARAGQFFLWRCLAWNRFWRADP